MSVTQKYVQNLSNTFKKLKETFQEVHLFFIARWHFLISIYLSLQEMILNFIWTQFSNNEKIYLNINNCIN